MNFMPSTGNLPVGVVGAGLAGLAAACTLAARGHKVILFDKNPWLGGKAAQLHEEGFRFDMGPTILTVPHVLERVFKEAGRSMHDYLDLRRLDPQWRCFFDDGSMLDLQEDVPAMAAAVAQFAPGNERGYVDFIAMSQKLHEVSEKFFFWKSVEGIADTLSMKGMNLDTLKDVLSLRMGTSVASQIRKRVPDGRVSQMLDHFVQYVGSSPYASPAVLCSIGHMQTDLGVWYPIGGTRAVPEALEKLAGELGVDLRPSTDVTRITMENGRANGVVTANGEVIRLSAVVSNMDSVRTMKELVQGAPGQKFARRWKRDPACSGVVLYLGLNRAYEHLAHHDFVFSKDPAEEFHWIYDKGEPAPDPTAYLAATSRTEPGVAPPGGEALYVLVHTPFLRPHHDWSTMFPAYRQVILDKLKRCAGMPDIEERIVFERHLTPQDIHNRYRVLNGAIYGLASHGKVNGAFKPGNRSRDLAGLYLAGGAAHPGPGMPMVLMSGWIAADSLCQDMQPAREPADADVAPSPLPVRGEDDPLTRRSPTLFRLFGWYLHWFFWRRFHAVRVSRGGLPRGTAGRPLIIYSNHPSWWDPALYILLCNKLFPGRPGFGPMDAKALGKYGILEKMGVFGVEQDTPRGAARFLCTSERVLADAGSILWITAEGTFTDPRQRPIRLRPGLAHLARRIPGAVIMPLAVEYSFWNESRPEALARFGDPIETGRSRGTADWTAHLEQRLTHTMDALAAESAQRNPALFHSLVHGGAGVGGVYDLWRRLRAWSAGQRFDPSHEGPE